MPRLDGVATGVQLGRNQDYVQSFRVRLINGLLGAEVLSECRFWVDSGRCDPRFAAGQRRTLFAGPGLSGLPRPAGWLRPPPRQPAWQRGQASRPAGRPLPPRARPPPAVPGCGALMTVASMVPGHAAVIS